MIPGAVFCCFQLVNIGQPADFVSRHIKHIANFGSGVGLFLSLWQGNNILSQDLSNCYVTELSKNPATDSYDFYVFKFPDDMKLYVNLAYNADGYVTVISIGSSHITNEYSTFTVGVCAVALSQIGLTHDEIQFLANNISEYSRTPQEICYASTVYSSMMQHSVALLINHETNGELLVFIARDPTDEYN